MIMIKLDCKHGKYTVKPYNHKSMSLNCPSCGSLWYSDSYGMLWYTAVETYTKLYPSFYPVMVDFPRIRPFLQSLKQLIVKRPSNELLFFDDRMTNDDHEFTVIMRKLERMTGGMVSSLPDSTTLLIDHDTSHPVCPDCFNDLLEILPY